ncbi:hypothetical protein F4802DRAFT_489787 [Xylaria palmicola]|nr:hypothetical protein F4802DRAFT_489787 [Xylaria palmicola]
MFTTSTSITEGSFVEVTMMTTIFGHIKAADPLTDFTTRTTFQDGTVSSITLDVYDMVLTSIEFDGAGNPTKTNYIHILNSAQITTLRDALGFPTATVDFYDVESVTTLFDTNSLATATVTTTIPETPVLTTIYDANGIPTRTTILLQPIPTRSEVMIPTPTPTSMSGDQRVSERQHMRSGSYFPGFHALASDRGASAADSLCLKSTGPASLFEGLCTLKRGNYLTGLTSFLVILSELAVPLSTEVLRLVLEGQQCYPDEKNKTSCSVALGVLPVPAQMFAAVLMALTSGVVLVALILRGWKTGVERNPWSTLNMAQLAAGTDMRKILQRLRRQGYSGKKINTNEFINKLQEKVLGLREWEENGVMKYSVLILTQGDDVQEKTLNKAGRSVKFADLEDIHRRRRRLAWPRDDFIPFFMLSWTGRILFLLLLTGVLTAVLLYNIVAREAGYQSSPKANAVSVRFLFSGAGVFVALACGSFFNAVAFLSPYKLLQRRRLNKAKALSVSPATSPFTGLWLAFVPSRRDLYLGVVAAATVLSELLPLYLGNVISSGIPVGVTETACVYLSVTTLSIIILAVGGSFFVDWPSMITADPSTIAGAMYAAHICSMEHPLKRFFEQNFSSNV